VLHYFSDVKYKNEAVLAEAFRLTVNSLLHDKEPPVKVIYNLKKDVKLPITQCCGSGSVSGLSGVLGKCWMFSFEG
jgi:hypothetical protein